MHPVFITATASILATILVMLFIRRLQHRIRIGRKMIELIKQDQYEFIIIDVRSSKEFHFSRIQGSLSLPPDDIRDNLPTEKMFEPLYVYGRSWRQARSAALLLDTIGYFNVICYGAYRGWKGPRESDNTSDNTSDKD